MGKEFMIKSYDGTRRGKITLQAVTEFLEILLEKNHILRIIKCFFIRMGKND